MYCHNCGKGLPDSAKFCDACGYRFPGVQTTQPVNPQPQAVPANAPTYQQYAPQPPYQAYPAQQQPAPGRVIPQKSLGIAAVLAFIIPGAGHIYLHKIGKGVLFLVASIVLGILAGVCLSASVNYNQTSVLGYPVYSTTSTNSGMVVLAVIFILAAIVLWLYQVYDAYKTAKAYNSHAMQTGYAPW